MGLRGLFVFRPVPAKFNPVIRHKIKKSAGIKKTNACKYSRLPFIMGKRRIQRRFNSFKRRFQAGVFYRDKAGRFRSYQKFVEG
jgi:hypothetical protein